MWTLLLLAGLAHGAIGPSREPLPALEVERGLVLPKGWTELVVAVGRKRATEAWSAAGDPVPLGGVFVRWTESLTLRHGLLPGHEVWLSVPWHQQRFQDRRASGVGDVSFGWRVGLLRTEPPGAAVALELGWTGALGATTSELPLGSGASAGTVGIAARRRFGLLALTGRVGWTHRFPGEVGTLPGPDRVVAPGDLLAGEGEALLQGGPLHLVARPRVARRGAARAGQERGALRVLRGTDALTLDLTLSAALALTRGVELSVAHELPVLGKSFALPFVESVHPTRGPTWTGALTVRL